MSGEPEPKVIGYLTEPIEAYNRTVDAAVDFNDLRTLLGGWSTLAPDAIQAARDLKDEEWGEWERGRKLERAGKFAGEAFARKFGAIMMPEPMLEASWVAEQFKVPWGLAWKRLREAR